MTLPATPQYRWTNGRLFVFTDGYRGWHRVMKKDSPFPKEMHSAKQTEADIFRWRAERLSDLWKKHSPEGETIEVVAQGQKFRIGSPMTNGGFVALGAGGETVLIPKGHVKDEGRVCADREIWEYVGKEAPHWRQKR